MSEETIDPLVEIKFSELVSRKRAVFFFFDGVRYLLNTEGKVMKEGNEVTNKFKDDPIVKIKMLYMTGGKRKKRNTKSKTKIRKTKKSNKKFRQTKSKSR
jgi:hypothetical protein